MSLSHWFVRQKLSFTFYLDPVENSELAIFRDSFSHFTSDLFGVD